jgi:glycosyltransferase involved in cell wall biosynthesis
LAGPAEKYDGQSKEPVPEISIVIPTHSRWHLLTRTLAGALGQEDVDAEVIVVDDGSTEETPERLAEISDPRLRVVRNETPERVARARNRGLEHATGEWVAFLDDDDLWAPRKLRAQLDAAKRVDAAFAYVGAILIDPELDVIDVQRAPEADDLELEILRRQIIPGGCSNMIAPTDLVRELGGFDPGFKVAEDWDMWIRILTAGRGPAVGCPDLFYGYYQHTQSSVVVNKDVVEADFEYIRSKHADLRRERGVGLDTVAHSRWLAQNFRRAGDRKGAARTYLRAAREGRDFGNVLRAGGSLLGEGMMQRFSPYSPEVVEAPEWLDLYRSGGPLASVAGLEADRV